MVSGDKFRQWQNVEVLTSESQYCIRLDAHNYDIKPSTVYRIRATVLINHVESLPSKLILLNTREAGCEARGAQSEEAPAVVCLRYQNYTIEYRDVADADEKWTSFEFESDESSQLLLSTLLPNRTYEARLFVNGHVVNGLRSRAVTFTTNNTAQLPEMSLDPEEEIVLDPDVSLSLEVRCEAVSTPPPKMFWLVDGKYCCYNILFGATFIDVRLFHSLIRSFDLFLFHLSETKAVTYYTNNVT
ncbi:unnamed protein product [Heligmosomoides polygyrus]|uniref:Fibronectin type-III domain-containing protein n=1 Tax=Heligmosomoides polygyrus TaxID=6339 RepID=A0A183GMH5_HELPZ|nr:unnamed protein product [Heligmosomoides polygyrus]